MKKIAILLIIPDIRKEGYTDEIIWNENVKKAYEMYNSFASYDSDVLNEPMPAESRWAFGYVCWKKMIEELHNENVDIYFIRTDYRMQDDLYEIKDNIINIKLDEPRGNIFYKTIISLQIFVKREK